MPGPKNRVDVSVRCTGCHEKWEMWYSARTAHADNDKQQGVAFYDRGFNPVRIGLAPTPKNFSVFKLSSSFF